jgi:Spy/CpxP family protein refolding chaperone
MKTRESLFLAAALAVLAAVPSLLADTTPAVNSTAPAAAPAPGKTGHGHKDHHMDMLSQQLGLTDEQKAKIAPILADQHKQLKALRADESLSADDRKAKRRDLKDSIKDQIRPLLSADQQQKFDALHQHHGKGKTDKV